MAPIGSDGQNPEGAGSEGDGSGEEGPGPATPDGEPEGPDLPGEPEAYEPPESQLLSGEFTVLLVKDNVSLLLPSPRRL
jgi:hypothetical protein